MEKEKILVTDIFYFSHNIFESILRVVTPRDCLVTGDNLNPVL